MVPFSSHHMIVGLHLTGAKLDMMRGPIETLRMM